MDAPQPEPGLLARVEREAPRLVLRAAGVDPQVVGAEGRRRRHAAHAAQSRQLQAQALERAQVGGLEHLGRAERQRRQLLLRGRYLDVLGPEQDLDAAASVVTGGLGAQRDLDRAERQAARRRLADEQVGGAEEGGDERRLRSQVELLGLAHFEQPTEVQHGDAVAELERLLLIVRHEDGGDAEIALHAADGLAQLDADLGVERAERLVEQEHRRAIGESARDRDALALAARELLRAPPAEAREPDQLEQLLAPLPALLLGDARDAQRELDVVRHRHVAEERVVLEHEADAAILGSEPGDVAAVEEDLAGVDLGEARDHAQERALAAAARPEQHEELAGRDLERDAVDDRGVAVALGEVLDADRHRGGVGEARPGLRGRRRHGGW